MTSHECHSVSHHRLLDFSFKNLFWQSETKHQSSSLLALCEGNSTVTGGFSSQMASNADIVSMGSWGLTPHINYFSSSSSHDSTRHDDVIKWKHFPRYWPFVRGIYRSPVNSPHKGQWRGALMFTFICARINGWVNNREAGDLIRYRTHYDVIVMVHWTNIWGRQDPGGPHVGLMNFAIWECFIDT